MAKKKANAAARRRDNTEHFDDSAYEGIRYSLTYEMDELSFSRAAALLAPPWLYNAALVCSLIGLIGIILVLVADQNNVIPAVIFFAIAILGSVVGNNWTRMVASRARKTTLGLPGEDKHRHVVITDKDLFELGPDDRKVSYPLSDLKRAAGDDEGCILDFGAKRYVYVPRAAMSENRYRSLVREARERAGQSTDKS